MRVLLFSRYSRLGASSRLRSLQYLPLLKKEGISVDVKTLYDTSYLERLYKKNRRNPIKLLSRYLQRALLLFTCQNYDLIWLEKELFPWIPPIFEKMLSFRGIPYVVDYDDAIFHRYDMHRSYLIKRLLGHKIDAIMKSATMVLAGNRYLADRARYAKAKHIEIIPTVVDLNRYSITQKANGNTSKPFTIGWIGSPTTFKYTNPLKPLLIDLVNRHAIRVTIIGAALNERVQVPSFRFLPWTEESEVSLIQSFDVGIMPLTDSAWEKGKCGYKLIQYMACGIPVVASNIGANIDIIEHGKNGFLVSSLEQWDKAIEILRKNPDLRFKMGQYARKTVEKKYHLGITAPLLTNALKKSMRDVPWMTVPDCDPSAKR